MTSLSQILSHIYTMATLFFSIILLELALLLRRASAGSRSITTDQFLKIVDQKAPARRQAAAQEEPCSVCLSHYEEGDEVRKLKCQHTFHKGCVDTWLLQDYATCPLCRQPVLPANVVMRHRNHRRRESQDAGDEETMLVLYALNIGNYFSRRFF